MESAGIWVEWGGAGEQICSSEDQIQTSISSGWKALERETEEVEANDCKFCWIGKVVKTICYSMKGNPMRQSSGGGRTLNSKS